MSKRRAFVTVVILLGMAAIWCYVELRISPYPAVQGRALSALWHHLEIVTASLFIAAAVSLAALFWFALSRAWHFAVAGALVTPPALLPWAYAGSSGEPLVTLALVASGLGVPLGVAAALLVWQVSRSNAVQLKIPADHAALGDIALPSVSGPHVG